MNRIWTSILIAGLAAGATALPASAQKASVIEGQTSLSASALAASTLPRATPSTLQEPLDAPNRWVCASRTGLEIQPVSGDVPTASPAWVVVYRHNGKPVASERIDPATAQAITAFDCDTAPSGLPATSPLLG